MFPGWFFWYFLVSDRQQQHTPWQFSEWFLLSAQLLQRHSGHRKQRGYFQKSKSENTARYSLQQKFLLNFRSPWKKAKNICVPRYSDCKDTFCMQTLALTVPKYPILCNKTTTTDNTWYCFPWNDEIWNISLFFWSF